MTLLKGIVSHRAIADLIVGKGRHMGRSLLAGTDDYDPDTWTLLGRAFDAAWHDISGNIDAAGGDDRRTRLALVILELARTGKRDQDQIKNAAVRYMRCEDRLGSRSC